MESFISEIQLFGFSYAPKNWAQCLGQILPIQQNQALYSLVGTTYGGDGVSTFGLPNLGGRSANSMGNAPSGTSYTIGQRAGEETHSLTIAEIPPHNHFMSGSKTAADMPNPDGNMLASAGTSALFAGTQDSTQMAANAIATGGGGQGHENRQPFLALNYCICLIGIFPSRS